MTNLRVPVGARIGGKQLIEVVDLGKSTLESQEVEFRSNDFLASVTEAPRISQSDNPELKQYFKSLAPGFKPLGDRITVIDGNGAIVNRSTGDKVNSGGKTISESDDKRVAEFVIKNYEYLRPQAEGDAANGDNPYSGEGGADGGLGMGSGAMGGYGGGMGRGSSLSGRGRGRGRNEGRGSGKGGGGESPGGVGQ